MLDDGLDLDEVVHQRSRLGIMALLSEARTADFAHLERTHREQAGHHAALRHDVQALRRDVSGTADDIRAVREDIGRLTSLITKGTS